MHYILLAEDNSMQAYFLISHISKCTSSDVIYKTNARDKLSNYAVDLFILDIDLPDMSGIELAQEIVEFDKYEFSWIIYLTALHRIFLLLFKKLLLIT
ncbi:response regulator [Herbivorax sp. ANBcel31]|uniref:response regulator n=1 Tax=Herbivorax sp. ANBcel31 TaxID=3069754 RepID=UPI0027B7CF51|nr:response regulator [Herbivorax sp. ANBcel31]MDQ2085085.1 response regulator [Herbivorax sp. ANBcel31]